MSQLYISMYHYTRELKNSRYPSIKGLDINLFRHQVEFFTKNFNVVTMQQVMDAMESKGELPPNALLMTFDDGYIDHYTFAFPILDEFKVQGSFFIPGSIIRSNKLLDVSKVHYILACANVRDLVSDLRKMIDYYRGQEYQLASSEEYYEKYAIGNRFDDGNVIFIKRMLQTVLPERLRSSIASDLFTRYVGIKEETLSRELYMSEEQIGVLKRHGMFIGVHGYEHCWLGNVSVDKMKTDIAAGLEALDGYIDRKKWVMNYPYGSYNSYVLDFVSEMGACLGLTTEVGIANIGVDNPLILPRLDCNDFPPKSEKYLDLRIKNE